MGEVADAKRRLARARARVKAAQKCGDWDQLDQAFDEETSAGRDLARLRGGQYAVPLDLGIEWDIGAPLPHVVSSGSRAIVIFYRRTIDADWDGTYVTVVDPAVPTPAALGLLEFTGCYLVKFGGLNDEAIAGHPLHGRGLVPYRAHTIRNSQWITEAEQQNSVHPFHTGGWHDRMNHYVLCFHDETLECLARQWRAEPLDCSVSDALTLASRLLLTRRA
jgi:hypothetical protein